MEKPSVLSKENNNFLKTQVNPLLLLATATASLVYFIILLAWFPKGHPILWGLLIAGEVFHLWQTLTYVFTVWKTDHQNKFDPGYTPAVDVFITVAGEPTEIIEETVRASQNLDYPNFKVHILNDGLVAKKANWREVVSLAEKLEVNCITREIPGGAKAGNINNGLAQTSAPFVAIFDADHVPHVDFLKKTAGYFTDSTVGFVQTPQFYKNFELNQVTKGAWEQQELFFGPILRGKNRLNSAFMCGTNMVVRRSALLAAGGMCETNIAEDFLTSLFIHEQGWKSVYVPEILSNGLAPEDFISYYKQQFRWARGSLEVIFRYNPLFRRGLTWKQKLQYLSSASYYLSGVVVLINALLPLIFFYTGLVPLQISTMALAAIFLPYIFLNILTLRLSSNFAYTFRALSFSMSSFAIYLKATWAVLTNQKTAFAVTAKRKLDGNFLSLTIPHIAYIVLMLAGLEVAILREGLSAAVVTNLSWALFISVVFLPFIAASLPETTLFGNKKPESAIRIKRLEGAPENTGNLDAISYSLLDNKKN